MRVLCYKPRSSSSSIEYEQTDNNRVSKRARETQRVGCMMSAAYEKGRGGKRAILAMSKQCTTLSSSSVYWCL
jgi:hypothetical protein